MLRATKSQPTAGGSRFSFSHERFANGAAGFAGGNGTDLTSILMFRRTLNLSFFIYILLNIIIFSLYSTENNFKIELFFINTIHGLISFFIIYTLWRRSEPPLSEIISIIFIYNVVLTLSFYIIFNVYTGKPFEFRPSDSLWYNHIGRILRNKSFSGILRYVSNEIAIDDTGFIVIVSYIYKLWFSPLAVVICKVFTHTFSIILLFRIAQSFLSYRNAVIGSVIYGTSLYSVFFEANGLKEIFMVFIVILSFYCFYRYLEENSIPYLIISLLIPFMLVLFRIPLAIFCYLSFGITIYYRRRSFKAIDVAAILMLIIGCIFLYDKYEPLLYRYTDSSAEMTFAQKAKITRGFTFGLSYLTAIISGFFGPFPTLLPISGKENLSLIAPSLSLRVMFSAYFLYGIFHSIKTKHFLLFPIVVFTFIEIVALIYLLEIFELRKSLPHMAFVIFITMYGLQVSKKQNIFINSMIVISVAILVSWSFLRF